VLGKLDEDLLEGRSGHFEVSDHSLIELHAAQSAECGSKTALELFPSLLWVHDIGGFPDIQTSVRVDLIGDDCCLFNKLRELSSGQLINNFG
jgi:hypothetical protein